MSGSGKPELHSDRNFNIDKLLYWKDVEGSEENALDIKELLGEFNIFHSLETGFETASIALMDAANFFEKEFTGTGVITVIITHWAMYPGEQDTLHTLKYYISGIAARRQVKEYGNVVVLDLLSEASFRNQLMRVCKKFSGSIQSHISSLLNDPWDKKSPKGLQLGTTRGSDSAMNFKKSLAGSSTPINEYQFISCNWKPLKAINFLVERAIYENEGDRTADGIFVERFNDYMFDSFTERFKDSNVKHIFHRSVAIENTMWTSNQSKFAYYPMIDFSFTQDMDIMRALDQGLLASLTHRYNVLRKSWKQDEISYSGAFISEYGSKMFRNWEGIDPFKNSITEYSLSRIFAVPHTEPFLEPKGERKPYDFVSRRAMFLASLDQIRLTFAVPGFSHVQVADPIGVMLPSQGVTQKGEDLKEAKTYVDKTHSGKYFITSINYRFNKHNAITTIECSRPELTQNVEQFLSSIGAINK